MSTTLNLTPTAASDIPHVILIDDDETIHALVGAMLTPLVLRISCASSGDEGLSRARTDFPDLILLDNDMPTGSGLDVLGQLKSNPAFASVPVIMVTGSESNKTLTSCFAAGAIDYIRKPFTSVELRARVSSVLERQRMLSELTNAALFDKLTGLANRALLTERLSRGFQRARENPALGFTLLLLDFDRFKYVNDTLGHDVGDLLLKAIAGRLRSNLRATESCARDISGNTVARLGGDEFVVLLDGVMLPEVVKLVADRLLEALAMPYQLGSHLVRSSASIGAAIFSAEHQLADDILRDADIAMYEAKARGKACYVLFTSEMGAAVRSRVSTESDLQAAIGTTQLHLAYQPIVSLEDHQVHGVEALARWTHPTLGNIPPSTFIAIAEETNLILRLSDHLLREACLAFVRWQTDGAAQQLRFISVNLSRVQFADSQLLTKIMAVLRETGVRPDQLQLEFTESQIMQNRPVALRLLAELRANGIRLAMDDFGTGSSSLSCLQAFPFDVLKVDRVFVANLSRGRDFAALLHAIVTLADNLGLQVIAEGIEEAEQLVMLQALGCGFGQGYLLGRPMSESVFSEWLTTVTFDGVSTGPAAALARSPC